MPAISDSVSPVPSAKLPLRGEQQRRLAHDLLDPHVSDAGNLPHASGELGRVGEVALQVASADLDVDRRGQAEVQDLGGDVAGQEAEFRAGKSLRQSSPQNLPIARDRRGLVVQRDRDVAILRPDRAVGAVGLIDAADGQAAVQQACRSRGRAAGRVSGRPPGPRTWPFPRCGCRPGSARAGPSCPT